MRYLALPLLILSRMKKNGITYATYQKDLNTTFGNARDQRPAVLGMEIAKIDHENFKEKYCFITNSFPCYGGSYAINRLEKRIWIVFIFRASS